MKEKKLFTGCLVFSLAASILLMFLLFLLRKAIGIFDLYRVQWWIFGDSDAVAIFNLWVDIIVGILTVWSLMWAASEFAELAVKPDIHLFPGRVTRQESYYSIQDTKEPISSTILRTGPFCVKGWIRKPIRGNSLNKEPHISVPVYLENQEPRAGQYVTLKLCIYAAPMPVSVKFIHYAYPNGEATVEAKKDRDSDDFIMIIPFKEDLIVYQVASYVGRLIIDWEKQFSTRDLPQDISLKYGIYTLDGNSQGNITLQIEWDSEFNSI